MSLRLAAHWTVTTIATMTALVAAPLPFPAPYAGPAGTVTAIGLLAIGYATAPAIRKRRNR